MRFFPFLLLLSCSLHAQSTSVLIDFGNTASPAPWNNISDTKNGAISGLLNTFGLNSGIDIAVADAFNGVNTNGTSMPDPALDMPASATVFLAIRSFSTTMCSPPAAFVYLNWIPLKFTS